MTKLKTRLFAILSAIGLGSVVATATHAATDTDLAAGIASGTALITDNKGSVIGFIIVVFGAVLVLTLLIVALNWGIRRLAGAFGGKRRR